MSDYIANSLHRTVNQRHFLGLVHQSGEILEREKAFPRVLAYFDIAHYCRKSCPYLLKCQNPGLACGKPLAVDGEALNDFYGCIHGEQPCDVLPGGDGPIISDKSAKDLRSLGLKPHSIFIASVSPLQGELRKV